PVNEDGEEEEEEEEEEDEEEEEEEEGDEENILSKPSRKKLPLSLDSRIGHRHQLRWRIKKTSGIGVGKIVTVENLKWRGACSVCWDGGKESVWMYVGDGLSLQSSRAYAPLQPSFLAYIPAYEPVEEEEPTVEREKEIDELRKKQDEMKQKLGNEEEEEESD
ncbi:Radial spokehead-like protein like protein, partial [Aduncisulcus paluster]